MMVLVAFALAQKRDGDLVAFAVRPGDTRLRQALDGYLQGMRQARSTLMCKCMSEEALSLIALARRE
jgi:hypothetical protein